MARLFISHSTMDNAAAIALCRWLAEQGFDDVFVDIDPDRGVVPGERWNPQHFDGRLAANQNPRREQPAVLLSQFGQLKSQFNCTFAGHPHGQARIEFGTNSETAEDCHLWSLVAFGLEEHRRLAKLLLYDIRSWPKADLTTGLVHSVLPKRLIHDGKIISCFSRQEATSLIAGPAAGLATGIA